MNMRLYGSLVKSIPPILENTPYLNIDNFIAFVGNTLIRRGKVLSYSNFIRQGFENGKYKTIILESGVKIDIWGEDEYASDDSDYNFSIRYLFTCGNLVLMSFEGMNLTVNDKELILKSLYNCIVKIEQYCQEHVNK